MREILPCKQANLVVSAFMVMISASAFPTDYVWWEAENPKEGNFPARSFLSPASDRERDALSGGDWLTRPTASETELKAAYEIDVPADGTYQFWTRKFGALTMRWRFDDAPWNEYEAKGRGADALPLDITEERYYAAAWFRIGDVQLRAADDIALLPDRLYYLIEGSASGGR